MKLEGIRVLDFSLFLPGPLLTQMMADQGAEVMKLEPLKGEPNREIGPKRDGLSVYYANTHRGKKSIQLDLKTPIGKEAALRLAATCDVVIEAFRPGVANRLGIGYEEIKKENPKVIYCSMSAWGQSGPYVEKPAHDLATEAVAGILSINLGQDGNPAIPGIAGADMLSSMMSLSAILMALLRRKDTQEGDYIDIAMADSLVAAVPNNLGSVFAHKQPPTPEEERALGGYAMYNIYETKDGRHVVIGGSEIHFAAAILEKLGRPDLLPFCEPPPGAKQQPAKDFLKQTFLKKNQDEWVRFFEGTNASFAPVNNLFEASIDPQLLHREMFIKDEQGWDHIGIPMKFKNEPGRPNFQFATPGEHTGEILESIGYSKPEIEMMKKNGVF